MSDLGLTESRAERVVLYTEDMEPITVIRLPAGAMDFVRKHGRITLAVQRPIEVTLDLLNNSAFLPAPLMVDIYADLMVRRGVRHVFLVTPSEEAALLLKSELLPGQQSDANEARRHAYAKGMLRAIQQMMR